MRRIAVAVLVLAVVIGAAGWIAIRPAPLPAEATAGITGDPERGEAVIFM